jgi:hypothetical protein
MIIEPQTKELLEQLPQTSHGKALIKFLDQVKEELNDISTLQSWEETIGRKNAIKMIDDLFKFMEPKKVEIKNKNQYI